jgi:myo-inositol 2-dehydrogenase/D-chiro-inositol 1-dehydrogenase
MLNVGIIGAGRIGKVHAETLTYRIPSARCLAIADINLAGAQRVAAQLQIPSVTDDYRAILDNDGIEAVLICSPTDTHARFTKEAAEAGKHIFCEKPIDHDLAKIDQALQAVEKAGVKLQIGFNRRFDPNFRKVRQMVAEGKVGKPHILRITSRDPAPPPVEYVKVSGGIFLDMTIHDFDMARFQVGEVVEVYATGGVLIEPELNEFSDIDTDVVILKFANGAVGAIDNSRKAVYGYDQRLEVFCSNGTAMADNEAEDTVAKGDPDGFHSARPPFFFMQRYAPCYVDEVRQFVECVRDDKPTPTTGADGRAAVVLGFAAWKSLRENRPVKVSEIG